MQRRELDLPNLDAVLQDVHRLHVQGCHKAGQWDLAQACTHMSIPINQSIDGYTFQVPWPLRLLGRTLIKKRMFSTRRIRAGLKAPANFTPAPGGNEQQAINDLEQAIRRFRHHHGEYQLHPIFGRMSPQQWHQFHTIHAMHHLSFLAPGN